MRHRESGFICALKVLEKGQITRENAEANVRREIEVHSNLRQPGILGFYNWFHDSRRIYLVLEYAAGGELVWLRHFDLFSSLVPLPLFPRAGGP